MTGFGTWGCDGTGRRPRGEDKSRFPSGMTKGRDPTQGFALGCHAVGPSALGAVAGSNPGLRPGLLWNGPSALKPTQGFALGCYVVGPSALKGSAEADSLRE
jgi:hypothetical protein